MFEPFCPLKEYVYGGINYILNCENEKDVWTKPSCSFGGEATWNYWQEPQQVFEILSKAFKTRKQSTTSEYNSSSPFSAITEIFIYSTPFCPNSYLSFLYCNL